MKAQHWDSRGHFFAAAAEAMRRILVENVRRRKSQKHGGGNERVPLDQIEIAAPSGRRLISLGWVGVSTVGGFSPMRPFGG